MYRTPWTRIVVAGLASAMILASLSYLINQVVLGQAHEAYDFFRSGDHPLVAPGLGITSVIWGVLFAWGYAVFARALEIQSAGRRGATYGALVFALFVAVHEVFYFQFIRFEAEILIGGLVHYALSMSLAGAVIGWLVPLRAAEVPETSAGPG